MESGLLIHDIVNKIEAARVSRPFKYFIVLLVLVLLGTIYNFRVYRNLTTQEAMDSAQLARNLAEGKGYTTLFIRPLSVYLVKQAHQANPVKTEPGKMADDGLIRKAHPDLANPPVYPLVLSRLMKLVKFRYPIDETTPFWSTVNPANSQRMFWRYQPDFVIAVFNEVLFLALIALTFLWARRLFDAAVAWTSAFFLFSSALLWRFSVSGLSTILLLVIFMGLIWCLTLLEFRCREAGGKPWMPFCLAALTGLAVAVGALTQYSFGWLIIPAVLFVALYTGARRVHCCLIVVAVFALAITPWIARNYQVSGTPFGTATFSILENSDRSANFGLERSLNPEIHFYLRPLWTKLFKNASEIIENLFPRMGGGLIASFFLAGLMVPFRNPSLRRVRRFVVMGAALMVIVQALGQTQLSEESPEINSENLLVLFLPLVTVYGVGIFFMLLDQIKFPAAALRYPAIGLFGFLVCLPMIFVLLLPKTVPITFPPYSPKAIQTAAGWMKENELIMSDAPWAVAWYGHRQCIWLTLFATQDPQGPSARESFFTVNDYEKPVNALYLTPITMNTRFVSEWLEGGEHSWGSFILDSLIRKEVPLSFPLRQTTKGFLPEQLFLCDWKRWQSAD